MAFDATGILGFTESGSCRIRKVTPDGIIRTAAGMSGSLEKSVGSDQ